jgi:hypothetical protein
MEAKSANDADAIYEILASRDRLACAVRDAVTIPPDVAETIAHLDDRLKKCAGRMFRCGGAKLEDLRDVLQPPDASWWWYPHRAASALWTVGAVLLLTLSVTMITDFTRRLLNADPDELGIFSIAGQSLLALAATSTFTQSGQQWIEAVLARVGVRKPSQQRWKLAGTLALMLIVFPTWEWGPGRLAGQNSRHLQDTTRPPVIPGIRSPDGCNAFLIQTTNRPMSARATHCWDVAPW